MKIWVEAPKHIQVGAVRDAAVSAPGRGNAMFCGGDEQVWRQTEWESRWDDVSMGHREAINVRQVNTKLL